MTNFDTFIQKAALKKSGKKKTRKQAFQDFDLWKQGRLDKETTEPIRNRRGKQPKAVPVEMVKAVKDVKD